MPATVKSPAAPWNTRPASITGRAWRPFQRTSTSRAGPDAGATVIFPHAIPAGPQLQSSGPPSAMTVRASPPHSSAPPTRQITSTVPAAGILNKQGLEPPPSRIVARAQT